MEPCHDILHGAEESPLRKNRPCAESSFWGIVLLRNLPFVDCLFCGLPLFVDRLIMHRLLPPFPDSSFWQIFPLVLGSQIPLHWITFPSTVLSAQWKVMRSLSMVSVCPFCASTTISATNVGTYRVFPKYRPPPNNRQGGGNLAWLSDIPPMGGYLDIKKIWEEGGLHGLSEIPPMGGNLVSLSSVLKSCQQNGFQCCSREIPSACTNEVLHTATASDKKTKLFEKKKLFDFGFV